MPIKRKNVVEYFPHFVNNSAKKHAIEGRFKAVGYTFWFKLLEILCTSGSFSISWDNLAQRDWLITETYTTEETALQMLEYLSAIQAIDPELWKSKIVWVPKLIENLTGVFVRRVDKTIPQKPIPLTNPQPNRVKVEESNNIIKGCKQDSNNMQASRKQSVSSMSTSCKQKKSKNGVTTLMS